MTDNVRPIRQRRKIDDPAIWQDPISAATENLGRFQNMMAEKPATRRYVVFFTPRSSSTRLCAAAEATGQLGNPREWFHPMTTARRAGQLGASSLAEYIDVMTRSQSLGDVFGAELTWFHLRKIFGNSARFRKMLAPQEHISLIRRDIVAQAISHARLLQTRAGHSVSSGGIVQGTDDSDFTYDADHIATLIQRLHIQEKGTERYFEEFAISPLRLSYEQLSRLSDREIAGMLADYLGIQLTGEAAIETGHTKVGGSASNDFARRFRAENGEFLAQIDEQRKPLLARFPE